MASRRDLREEIQEELNEQKVLHRNFNKRHNSLIDAIKAQDLNRVQHLLETGIDPNYNNGIGDFPIHYACRIENSSPAMLDILETLLYMGANHETPNRFGFQPLHIAAGFSHQAVQILLDKGSNINAQDIAGCTPLMEACRNNRNDALETVSLLVQRNCNLNLQDNSGFTAVHFICQNTFLKTSVRNQIALLLLRAGASAITNDHRGRMPLCLELYKIRKMSPEALLRYSLDMVSTMVIAGANLQHNSRSHQDWIRKAAITAPQVLCTLLDLVAPIVTRRSLRLLRLICVSTTQDVWENGDELDEIKHQLQVQVQSLSCTVPSLRAICRLSLRAQLRGKMLVYVPMLPLPETLKNYLISLENR